VLATIALFALSMATVPTDTTLVPDLPLIEARAPRPNRTLAIVLSGDGNWMGFERGLLGELNAAGISVLGLKMRSYLDAAPRKTPEIVAHDLERMLAAYVPAWQADTVILIGYSRGADIAPFVMTRLAARWRERIPLLVLVSPAQFAGFQFHLMDLMSSKRRPGDLSLLPEVERLSGLPILCVYGDDDKGALCPVAPPGLMQSVALNRGHQMDGAHGVGAMILDALRRRR
jgi:type IV secretory pathway VirJ component